MPEDDIVVRIEKGLARKKLVEEYSIAAKCVRETFAELSNTTMAGQDFIKSFSGLIVILGQMADRMIYFLGKSSDEILPQQFDEELKSMSNLNNILITAKRKLEG